MQIANRRILSSLCSAGRAAVYISLLASMIQPRLIAIGRVQAPAPMRVQAQQAAQRPIKLDVHPLSQGARVGQEVTVEVALLDANNKPLAWGKPCQVLVAVKGPSGKVEKYSVTIPAGQSTSKLTFPAHEVGLLNLTAHEVNETLLAGGNSMLVGPVVVPKQVIKKKPKAVHIVPSQGSGYFLAVSTRSLAATDHEIYEDSEQGPPTDGTAATPITLLLTNASGKDEILADGKDFARIQVYYVDPQGAPAPADVKIWLSPSNGQMDQQPLVIKKGEARAEGQWTSLSPVDANISFSASAPGYGVQGDRTLKVSFVPAIYGIAPANGDPLRISLIDCAPVIAQFFDKDGRTIQTNKPRHITFVSSSPSLYLDPSTQDVLPKASEASIFIIPTWAGNSSVDIWTPGYDHQTLRVEVTIWVVLLLCLAGGVVGGIAARDALKGTVLWRIFVGILGAIVLVWLSVYAVLPQTHSIIAHNQISVFVVGILGGYSGTRALDFVGKKLGYL